MASELVACPERTKEGYGVLLYRLTDFEPSHVDFLQGIKTFFAFNDVRLSEDGVIPGYVVVFDMRGITLSHLGVVTLSGIRKFMHYIQVSRRERRGGWPPTLRVCSQPVCRVRWAAYLPGGAGVTVRRGLRLTSVVLFRSATLADSRPSTSSTRSSGSTRSWPSSSPSSKANFCKW